jgi:hypothetical protein
MIPVELFKRVDLIKINEDVGSFPGCHFDARYAENIAILIYFNGAPYFIMVG